MPWGLPLPWGQFYEGPEIGRSHDLAAIVDPVGPGVRRSGDDLWPTRLLGTALHSLIETFSSSSKEMRMYNYSKGGQNCP
jgi:hypothetical protein